MDSNLYQDIAMEFYTPDHRNFKDLRIGLIEEAYEVNDSDNRGYILDELSDVLWYVAAIAKDNALSLEQVMRHNLNKLEKRALNGKV